MDPTQKAFLGLAAVVLLFNAFQGWRLGPVRQLVGVLALLAAYLDAWYFSAATVPFLHSLGLPNIVLQVLGGTVLGVLTYVFVLTIGRILFKKTSDQRGALVWFFYGVTGAFLGMAVGLVFILVAAIGIRVLGTLADGIAPKGAVTERQPAPAPTPADWLRTWPVKRPDGTVVAPDLTAPKRAPSINNPAATEAVSTLVHLKRSLNEGIVGEVVQTIDPVPKETYEILGRIGQLTSKSDAIGRFLSFPGARELVTDPAIAALQNDPDIARAIQKQDFAVLMRNPKVVKVCNNPGTAVKLKKFDLRKALDYALAQ